jgi:predicted ArsR family transcriptional regulator
VPEPQGRSATDSRGRILALLCSANHTGSELARALGMSANGVRGHLERLEKEGLVEHRVVRRGVGKPAHEYLLTADGSMRLSRGYFPLLAALLRVVRGRGGAAEEEAVLREAGRAVVLGRRSPGGSPRSRADAAVDLLAELGGISSVSEDGDALSIRGTCCVVRGLVPDHPLVCKAVEGMLSEFMGAPVRAKCETKKVPPICRLVIATADR